MKPSSDSGSEPSLFSSGSDRSSMRSSNAAAAAPGQLLQAFEDRFEDLLDELLNVVEYDDFRGNTEILSKIEDCLSSLQAILRPVSTNSDQSIDDNKGTSQAHTKIVVGLGHGNLIDIPRSKFVLGPLEEGTQIQELIPEDYRSISTDISEEYDRVRTGDNELNSGVWFANALEALHKIRDNLLHSTCDGTTILTKDRDISAENTLGKSLGDKELVLDHELAIWFDHALECDCGSEDDDDDDPEWLDLDPESVGGGLRERRYFYGRQWMQMHAYLQARADQEQK